MAKGRRVGGRYGMGTEQRCGCKIVRRRIRGMRDVVVCPGTPMLKIAPRSLRGKRGTFCTQMLRPFPKHRYGR